MIQEELDNSDCLIDGLDHHYEFAGASAGSVYWVCVRCPSYIEELEDSIP